MDKKYVIPEGMGGYVARAVFNECGKVDFHPQIRVALEAAVRWLSDNPIAPTMAQAEAMRDSGHPCILDGAWYAGEWQRRMFLAPIPADDREMIVYDCLDCKKSWKQHLREKVASCVYCQSTNTKSIATVSAVRNFELGENNYPDPAIKDLLWDRFRNIAAQVRHDAAVIEAYHRGIKAAGK